MSEEDGPARNSKPPAAGGGGGILGALQLALEQREKAIHSSGKCLGLEGGSCHRYDVRWIVTSENAARSFF